MNLKINFINGNSFVSKDMSAQNLQEFVDWANDKNGLPMFQIKFPNVKKSVFFRRDAIAYIEMSELPF
jgi:hypothetical protein